MTNPEDSNLDKPVWGARAIAKEANLFDDEGNVDERKAYYLLESGAIAAKRVKGRDKEGNEKKRGQWVSTPRLIRDSLLPSA
jgi:hypothetical protein